MLNLSGTRTASDKLRYLLGVSASALAISAIVPAYAQDVVTIPDEEEDDAEVTRDVVVVTGSRIRQDEFSSSAPIQVIDPRIGELQGQFDTASLVQSSSIAAGSAQITAAISSNFVTNGGTGTSTVSLRGLGADRTLVLLNGRRAGPAGTRGAVNAFDLNVIPQSVIGSVEILKDGASSIYGSDAIAGVVNLITKKDLDGLELDAFWSQPFDTGGRQIRTSATYGKEFDRGHFQIAFDYFKQDEVRKADRDFLDCPESYIFNADGTRADYVDPRPTGLNFTGPNGYACEDGTTWGHIWLYDYSYYYSPNGSNVNAPPLFDENGVPITGVVLFQFDYNGGIAAAGLPTINAPLDPNQIGLPPGFFPIGYNRASNGVTNNYSALERYDTIIPKTERFTIYSDAAYELTDGIEAYIEFLGNRRKTTTQGSSQFWNFTSTSDFSLFGGAFPANPNINPLITGPALISPTTQGNKKDASQIEVDYYRVMGGLRGELTTGGFLDGWQWDLYGQYSRNSGDYTNDRLLQDAVDLSESGASCVGVTSPVSGRPCIDIDYNDPAFLAGFHTAEQAAYLFDQETGNTLYEQTYVEGLFTGNLFEMPAGSVGVAVGGVWRRDEIDDLPGPITLAGNAWGASAAGNTVGSSNTKEIFGEIIVPILRDSAIANHLTVNGSLRYTDVSTAGSDLTWKAGLDYQVNDTVRLRGTWGTSFRAPALFELFLADQTSFLSQRRVDPCIQWGPNLTNGAISQRLADNCAAQGVPPNHTGGGVSVTVTTGGGLGVLEPETSTAKTAGIVLTPDFLVTDNAKLELAIDYFNIEVNGEIATLSAGNIVSGCLNSEFFPTDPLCSLFTRGQTGAPSNIADVRASFVNINSQVNTGIDITARYQHEQLLWGWDLDALAQFTRQFKDTVALFEGTEVSVNGEAGEPLWVGDLNLIATKNDWTVFWGLDIVGPTSDEGDYLAQNASLCPTSIEAGFYCVDLKAETRVYHNVSVSKDFESASITVGVSNLFDLRPPRVTTAGFNQGLIQTVGQAPFTSNYDFLGRRIFINAKKSF